MAGSVATEKNNAAGNTDYSRKVEALCGKNIKGHGLNLAGWPTPTKGNADGSQMAKGASATGRRLDGSKATVSLNHVSSLAGWPTPQASDGSGGGQAKRAMNADRSNDLMDFAMLAGWPTPTTRDHKDGSECPNVPTNSLLGREVWKADQPVRITAAGQVLTGSDAGTASSGQLNPSHSRWLMGFPVAWDQCAMHSHKKSSRK
ncbi:hypothetical protein [Komagataeibacter phage phiKX1]|nr:hypothetical protein [Komagataeibacter phage phiKX1]BCZ76107.1 hypothetical protein [Komagataeibacter phage phiKX2]